MPEQEGYNIIGDGLDQITTEAGMAGTSFEVAKRVGGTVTNFEAPFGVIMQALNANLAGPNNRKDLRKAVAFKTPAQTDYVPGRTTLATLDPEFLCVGATCTVLSDEDGGAYTEYELQADPTGPLIVWPDGSFREGVKVNARWVLKVAAAGGGSNKFTITPTESDGGIQAGQTYTNVTSEDLWRLKLVRYQAPGFTSFTLGGAGSQDVEVGTSFPQGFKSVQWSTNNPQNVAANSIRLRDVTAGTDLLTNEANDGTASASTSAYTATPGEFRRYRLSGTNSNNAGFSADIVQAGYYRVFYGPGNPTSSAQVRALSGSQLSNQGNQLTLNTGNTSNRFALWLPPGKTLQSVVDLDALNADITSQYVGSALSVTDAGGSLVAGTLYVMAPAVAYSSNHRHLITLS